MSYKQSVSLQPPELRAPGLPLVADLPRRRFSQHVEYGPVLHTLLGLQKSAKTRSNNSLRLLPPILTMAGDKMEFVLPFWRWGN